MDFMNERDQKTIYKCAGVCVTILKTTRGEDEEEGHATQRPGLNLKISRWVSLKERFE